MQTVTHEPGRLEVLATGLVELARDGRAVADRRLCYDGIVYQPGQRVAVRTADVPALERAGQIQVLAHLPPVQWWDAPGRILQAEPGRAKVFSPAPVPGALRIVQGTAYDPGNAAYRFHTAVNEYSPHASAFVRYLNGRNNPYGCPTQYDATDLSLVRALCLDADVVHCHINTILTQNAGLPRRPRPGQVIVKHYHGTQFDAAGQPLPDDDQQPIVQALQDDVDGYVLVGARLQVCALRPGRIQWLPITVPVDRYAAMAARRRLPWDGRRLRIAHSPTVSAIKGTGIFLEVCQQLQRGGLPIEPVLIERQTHARALALRATCDVTFDAFALGIQGSGLEGAAMGHPVLAGDPGVAALYREELGAVPYTYVNDAGALRTAIERLATDPAYFSQEAARVGTYCRTVHDYPAVAARYDLLLRAAGAHPLD